MLLTTNLLIKEQNSFNGPLGIKGILFSPETTIIGKTSRKLNKEASRKINKYFYLKTIIT